MRHILNSNRVLVDFLNELRTATKKITINDVWYVKILSASERRIWKVPFGLVSHTETEFHRLLKINVQLFHLRILFAIKTLK